MKLGYIIANQHEEFIHSFNIQKGFALFSWTLYPAFSHVFKSREQCRKVMKSLSGDKYTLWEMSLFETETQYIVFCDDPNFPPWYGKNNPANHSH